MVLKRYADLVHRLSMKSPSEECNSDFFPLRKGKRVKNAFIHSLHCLVKPKEAHDKPHTLGWGLRAYAPLMNKRKRKEKKVLGQSSCL